MKIAFIFSSTSRTSRINEYKKHGSIEVFNSTEKETKMLKHKRFILLIWLFCLSIIAPGQSGKSDNNNRSNQQAIINGCQLFPTNNTWNTPIDI